MKDRLEEFSRQFDPRWRFFHRVKHEKKILELGCGTGFNFSLLQSLSATAEFHGVDIVPAGRVPRNIRFRNIDLDKKKLPYPDNSFQAILFTHVIEHLKNPLALGEEIHRVLKPDGLMYIETPNWTSMLVPSFGLAREQHGPFNFFDDPTHVKPWTKQGVYEFLRQACRLEVERVATVRNWPRIPWDIAKFLAGVARGNRERAITAFWNISGWCIYGVGRKSESSSGHHDKD